ncbi:XRE family transcriptional regulator [Pseudomonas sp. 21LCFQ010]|uniref:helix-turn-helix domain-containing protein n=1 Tax=Pseudomonas sp. 21LCFQ010 TaxID=2957506 RepID=UPI0020981D37|nr:XRE family transcriptional regulator [Pseudomonas sp. 21LCFQ010]MCO8162009.1 XRE family transcriptional regulator [Pseudomonas sp. 21LCFQ010]
MDFKDRLKAARQHANLTQGQLAERIGITQTSISDLERGKSKGTAFNARIAEVCRVSALWLESGSGEMHPDTGMANVVPMQQPHREAREYPLVTWVDAGVGRDSFGCYPAGISDEWLSSTENAGPGGFWLTVRGKSMTSDTPPSFPEGTPILIRPEGFDLISGKFYIAVNRVTGEKTFKKYELDAGVGYLVPLNPDYHPVVLDDDWVITGRAIDAKIPGM